MGGAKRSKRKRRDRPRSRRSGEVSPSKWWRIGPTDIRDGDPVFGSGTEEQARAYGIFLNNGNPVTEAHIWVDEFSRSPPVGFGRIDLVEELKRVCPLCEEMLREVGSKACVRCARRGEAP